MHTQLVFKMIIAILVASLIFTMIMIYSLFFDKPIQKPAVYEPVYIDRLAFDDDIMAELEGVSHLPIEYRYTDIDKQKLKNWLGERNSYLAEDKYIDDIVAAGKSRNVNPLLLFAIIGQEQSFVPMATENCAKIANNPFNVFGSWQDYNTTLQDAAMIAAKTLNTLSKDRPIDVGIIQWINTRGGKGGYAEDVNWHKGVEYFMAKLQEEVLK